MNVVDKHAETVVRQLWNAVADISRAPKFMSNVSRHEPSKISNTFNIPLFDSMKPGCMHVQIRKQPSSQPFRFLRPCCTCWWWSFGILINVGMIKIETLHFTCSWFLSIYPQTKKIFATRCNKIDLNWLNDQIILTMIRARVDFIAPGGQSLGCQVERQVVVFDFEMNGTKKSEKEKFFAMVS